MNRLTRPATVTAYAVLFFLFLSIPVAQAQFLGLQSEVYAETELGTTYRIYGEFASASDECIAVYSVGTSECVENDANNDCIQDGPLLLELGVTTAFFQHPAAGNMGSDINPFFFPFYPEMEFDSWLTIGSSSTADEAVSNIGMMSDLAEFASGSGFVLNENVGGSWYVTPGANSAALAGDNGLVLLGQFTAVDEVNGDPGHVTCLWNIQWRNSVGVSFKETGIVHDTSGDGTVSGCMEATACNYNISATESDGSCAYATGCDVCGGNATDGTGSVVDNDADDDGVCDADEIAGCQSSLACNFNAAATDAATCVYATGCDVCSGNATDGTGTVTDLDADDDGVCDADEIEGCQNSAACNYDASATDSGAECVFPSSCETCSGATDGTGSVVDNDSDGDGVCDADEIAGCQVASACNYNAAATDAGTVCIYASDCESCSGATDGTGTILDNDDDNDGVCNADEIAGCQNSSACNYNASATDAAECFFAAGCDECQGNSTDGTGTVNDLDADNDGVCDADEVAGCQNSTACNYNASATDTAACFYATGCDVCSGNATDGTGTVTDLDTDNDGVCDADEIVGCQNSSACNYNASATDSGTVCVFPSGCETCSGSTDGTGTAIDNDADNDGVCNADEISGCQDNTACNYNMNATDGGVACLFASGCETCSGATDGSGSIVDNDADDDGVCNADEIAGCQDSAACNFNASATDAGASCIFPQGCETCSGQTDGTGTTVDNDADDDGVCDADELGGCQDNAACNYDANATNADETCVYAIGCDYCSGETDGSGVIVNGDVDADEVCDVNEIPGCQDPVACNYNEAATDDDNSCTYEVLGYDCNGDCLFDVDQDGVCDQWEITGCQDDLACNYDATATNAGYCDYAANTYDCDGNCLNDADGDGLCDELESSGCLDPNACNYDAQATDSDGSCTYASSGYDCAGVCLADADDDGVCDANEIAGCTDDDAMNFSAAATDDNGSCVYCEDADSDGVCDNELAGCTDSLACNYDATATENDGSCMYAVAGYGCDGMCLSDGDSDGVCDANEVPGCTDYVACNFAAAATDDDASCTYATEGYDCDGGCLVDSDQDGICDQNEVTGCQASDACNYDETATDAGYCVYPAAGYDCSGECLFDSDSDGVCDANEVPGCTDYVACNFAAAATDDDASCTYATEGYDCDGGCLVDSDQDGICDQNEVTGCQANDACNYDETATDAGYCDYPMIGFDCDGNCLPGYETLCSGGTTTTIVLGCMDNGACNFDVTATEDNGSCWFAETGYDCSGECLFDSDSDGVCNAFEVPGCTDYVACNFAAAATDDDATCTYATEGYDCDGGCLVDSDQDGICDQNEVTGCQASDACNYDETATDAGYCVYPAAGYDCSGECLFDSDSDGVCDANEVPGCTDYVACNFAAAATDDDASCTYATEGYDCDGGCLVDSDQDGICDQNEVTGCQASDACNYDETATDAGYCDYPMIGFDCDGNCLPGYETLCSGGMTTTIVLGCMDNGACNFDVTATEDNGSCWFAETGYDCSGECLFDSDSDGVCNAFEVPGCTDYVACNFAAAATDDDASCTYATEGYDCDGGCLVDSDQDGICDQNEVTGCQASDACNYDETATDAGYCDYPMIGFDCDGNCLPGYETLCSGGMTTTIVLGCMDNGACNFDVTATEDNGSCWFAETGYDCSGECLFDSDSDGVCNAFEVPGCTDYVACNFAAAATDDDASCTYATEGYDCDGGCLVDSDQDGICDQNEVTGCQASDACNYDPLATDNGYCDYASEIEDCDGNCLNDENANGICDELEDGLPVENNCAEATEEFMAALASGLYCGDGTVWVDAFSECMVIPTCFGDLDNSGNRGTEDLLIMLSVFGAECDLAEGCTDPLAENYDPFALVDDNTCIVIEDPCGLVTSITYHGDVYDLVSIGDQCWFRDNLASQQFQNGDAVGLSLESADWYAASSEFAPACTAANGDETSIVEHGYLYNGYAVNDARGLCPSDWHVASDGDWMSIEASLGMDSLALTGYGDRGTDQGDQLKASASDTPAWDGTNTSGFSGAPSGQRYSFGSFNGFGTMSLLWTGSNSGSSNWARKLESGNAQVERSLIAKGFGGSVRCVMD